ncbi:2-aminomuconate deaminase [Pigmentiphaga sp. NML080357]|uniref:RidA family protein n=1 Tax=Pigmentiphaga sp. NML080357 TaxID=2008675 RepID=UPI000B419893|nr:RidA family protein [Pigmentiphaga sp. NML080357]OVZ56589.1 2-aminomuconate deaminase [Pigmentiphaga sp. NML080357]
MSDSATLSTRAQPLGKYPPFKRVGDFIYLSGISARMPDGSIAGTTRHADGSVTRDVEVQTRVVIENVRATLAEAGADLADCVDILVFLTDMQDFPKYNAVYGEYFEAGGPARTTVAVSALPRPDMVVEMKAVAWRPRP